MNEPAQKALANRHLQNALKDTNAKLHDDQWRVIWVLVRRKKALIVQRTGWGKSAVYFIATKMLRERDRYFGLTLVVSPLLSLVRNQEEAAARFGLAARSMNSENYHEWSKIEQAIKANRIDILFVTPERLANTRFQEFIGEQLVGMIVVDEAHCVSDWGHDFRPDYRRVHRVFQNAHDAPILATTATATKWVVEDIKEQMGDDTLTIRGSLARDNLRLPNFHLISPSLRAEI